VYKVIIGLITLLFMSGCEDKTSQETVLEEPFYQEQWAIHYDRAFYTAYNIDKDAHIHAKKAFSELSAQGVKIAIIDVGLDAN